ncbi:MAG: hypothetical protein JJT90_10265 [Ectothiorhodospiraceae bacterium]|nr:hypothetical protein [Ectothiorhodospiraceae bacterium]
MGDVVPFRKPDRKRQSEGRTLCRHGLHKWKAVGETRFDVKQGKLVTLYRCARCGKESTALT